MGGHFLLFNKVKNKVRLEQDVRTKPVKEKKKVFANSFIMITF